MTPTTEEVTPATATRRLLLAPDWSAPSTWLGALTAHLSASRPGDGTVLYVDPGPHLGAEVCFELLGVVCEAATGGRPFGEVVVLTGGDDLGDAVALEDAPGPVVSVEDPAAIVAHARAVKALSDTLRDRADRDRFERAEDPWTSNRPLVSVRIPTWRGHELLCTRTLPSVLAGSWRELEVVVCSDGPDPDARAAVEAFGDRRVRYVEVGVRPEYPSAQMSFWRVAGTAAANVALDHCTGRFVAPLDHDDAYTAGHVAELLAVAARAQADFVWGQALCELAEGPWVICGSQPLAAGELSHGATMWSSRLGHMRHDADAWLIGEPGDWNMWRRMQATGAPLAFHPAPVLVHFAERSSVGGGAVPQEPTIEELAADVLRTPARRLLDVVLA